MISMSNPWTLQRCEAVSRRSDAGPPSSSTDSRRAERGDVVQQAILSVGRQECQQALGEPGTGLVGVKARLAQRGRPVTSEVDGNHARSAVAVASRSASVVIGMRARQDLRPG